MLVVNMKQEKIIINQTVLKLTAQLLVLNEIS